MGEAFHLLGSRGTPALSALLQRQAVIVAFDLGDRLQAVLKFIDKYADVPGSLADGSLVRMTEILADPLIPTTDRDFRVYRRHGRQVVPCVMPS